MEGTILINKAGTFKSEDTWNLIPLHQEMSKGNNLKIINFPEFNQCL